MQTKRVRLLKYLCLLCDPCCTIELRQEVHWTHRATYVAMVQVIRSFVPVSGIPTEVLTAAASTAAPLLQVLVIPGNPGNAGFYRTLMQQLHQALGGRAHVVSFSHAGHDTGPHNLGQQLWTLQQQIQHKADFIEQHLLLPGRPPLMVLGHSIGAYMALHAVHQLETSQKQADCTQAAPSVSVHVDARGVPHSDTGQFELVTEGTDAEQLPARFPHLLQHNNAALQQRPPIIKVVAMMPFLETNFQLEFRQRALRFIAGCYRAMATVARLLAALPLVVSIAVVQWWTRASMDAAAVQTTCQLLRPSTVIQFFYMAHHEFADLSHPFNWGIMRRLSTRLHVLGCPGDLWLSPQQFHHMTQQVPGLQCEEVTHLVVRLATKALRNLASDGAQLAQLDGTDDGAVQQLHMDLTSAATSCEQGIRARKSPASIRDDGGNTHSEAAFAAVQASLLRSKV